MSEIIQASYLVDDNGQKMELVDKTARDRLREKPLVYIDGDIPTTKDEVLAEMRFVSSWMNFHAYIIIKCQGNSSMAHPKKNFTVKLFSDEARTEKMKIVMPGWKHASNKFVLKANWIDHSHSRNVITARLWGEIVTARSDYDTLPEELRNSPNNGAIDGFPILVTTNGTYQGIYTWNVGKDDWMWGMDEDNPDHILLANERNTDGVFEETPSNFRAPWDGANDEYYWTVEVGENNETVKNALNALIACVNEPTDIGFKNNIDKYLDVQSAIDYYLLACADCGLDNLAKNMLLAKYTPNKWYLGTYDVDATWGNNTVGTRFMPPTYRCPEDYQERYNLLFERITELYGKRMKDRGLELRKTVLSYANIMWHFEQFAAEIGKEAYADDIVPYPDIPQADTNNIWQLRNFVRDRLAYFDGWLEQMTDVVPCESITLNKSELSIVESVPTNLTATVYPVDCNQPVSWVCSNPSIASVVGGLITPVANGNVVITAECGGFTASCSVAISGVEAASNIMYSLAEPVTIASEEDAIDTGVKLFDEEKSFTIALDITPSAEEPTDRETLVWANTAYPQTQLYENLNAGKTLWQIYTSGASGTAVVEMPITSGGRRIVVLRYAAGTNTTDIVAFDGTNRLTNSAAFPVSSVVGAHAKNVHIGAKMKILYTGAEETVVVDSSVWHGTLHRCVIYDKYLSDDEVTAFIDGMTD